MRVATAANPLSSADAAPANLDPKEQRKAEAMAWVDAIQPWGWTNTGGVYAFDATAAVAIVLAPVALLLR